MPLSVQRRRACAFVETPLQCPESIILQDLGDPSTGTYGIMVQTVWQGHAQMLIRVFLRP